MGTVLGGFLFSEHCLLLNQSKTFFQDSEEVYFSSIRNVHATFESVDLQSKASSVKTGTKNV
jgi:hypothetical protein